MFFFVSLLRCLVLDGIVIWKIVRDVDGHSHVLFEEVSKVLRTRLWQNNQDRRCTYNLNLMRVPE